MPFPTPVSDDNVRDMARAILSRSPYAEWRPHGRFALIEQILNWLRGLNEWLGDLAETRPVLYMAILGGLILLSTLLIAHLVYSLRAALAAARRPKTPPPQWQEVSLLDEAAALARDGRYLAAARQVQLAVIEALLQRRLVDLMRSEPNRVLRRRLRAAALPGTLGADITALLDRLERQWFRDRQEDQELYEAWRRLHDVVAGLPEPT